MFDKQFITYIVILYNHNSFTEIKNLRWSWPLITNIYFYEYDQYSLK